jgi:hypothetical protein
LKRCGTGSSDGSGISSIPATGSMIAQVAALCPPCQGGRCELREARPQDRRGRGGRHKSGDRSWGQAGTVCQGGNSGVLDCGPDDGWRAGRPKSGRRQVGLGHSGCGRSVSSNRYARRCRSRREGGFPAPSRWNVPDDESLAGRMTLLLSSGEAIHAHAFTPCTGSSHRRLMGSIRRTASFRIGFRGDITGDGEVELRHAARLPFRQGAEMEVCEHNGNG